jgi:hypothetical protein
MRFRLPDFHDIQHMKVVSSASRTGRLYPQEMFLVPILLGSESTPGHWYGQKECVTEKSIWFFFFPKNNIYFDHSVQIFYQ